MGDIYANIKLRPTRIGFLVKPTDLSSVRRILQACCCVWGGTLNPIIPIFRTAPSEWRDERRGRNNGYEIARGYIRFFEPDVYVEAEKGLAELVGLGALREKFIDPQIVTLDEFFDIGERSRGDPEFGLSVYDVVKEIYETERRFKLRDDQGAIFPSAIKGSCLVETIFGAYPVNEKLRHFRRNFEDVFKPDKGPATSDSWLKVFRTGALTPLRVTRHKIDVDQYWYHDPIIFVFDPSKPTDVIDLWNQRIQPYPILPVPVEWLGTLSDGLKKFIGHEYRPVVGNPYGMMHDVSVQFGSSLGADEAKRLVEQHFHGLPEGSFHYSTSPPRIWDRRDRHMSPHERVSLNIEERRVSAPVERDRGGSSIQFETISPPFASQFGGRHWRWVNVVTVSSYSTDDIASVLPRNTFDRRWPRLSIGAERVIITSEGWVIAQRHTNWTDRLNLLENDESIRQWFATQKIEAKLSEPGRIGKQILKSLERLWAVHILRDPETLKLLNKMAFSTRRRKNETEEIEETFEGRSVSVKMWREHVERRRAKQLPRLEFDDFTDRKVIRLGIETTCPLCDYKNWHGLDVIDYEVTCERCLGSYPFPQAALRDRNENWKYRVIGPFSTPDFARGSYAALLTIKAIAGFYSTRDVATYSPALDLTFADGTKAEIDFAMWLGGEERFGVLAEPQLLVGEAKSFGDEVLGDEDYSKLKRIGTALPTAALVVSVLKDQFSDKETEQLTKLVHWAARSSHGWEVRTVLLLTGVELFAPFSIESAWKDRGEPYVKFAEHRYHFDSIAGFAEATQKLHLGITATEILRKRQHKLVRRRKKRG
jgi:hypothetical protein